jgi:hypothetical protein
MAFNFGSSKDNDSQEELKILSTTVETLNKQLQTVIQARNDDTINQKFDYLIKIINIVNDNVSREVQTLSKKFDYYKESAEKDMSRIDSFLTKNTEILKLLADTVSNLESTIDFMRTDSDLKEKVEDQSFEKKLDKILVNNEDTSKESKV